MATNKPVKKEQKEQKVQKEYKPKSGELVKANAFTGREKGYMYFVGKDNAIYKLKMTGKHKAKPAKQN